MKGSHGRHVALPILVTLAALSAALLQLWEWAEKDDPRLPTDLTELVPNYHNVWWARNLVYVNPETRGGDWYSYRNRRNWKKYIRKLLAYEVDPFSGWTVPFDTTNWFGHDVLKLHAQGNLTWAALCRLDSDGDGLTNGEELGDPCCQHDYKHHSEPQVVPYRKWKLSHPGGDDDPVWPPSLSAGQNWSKVGSPQNCSAIPHDVNDDELYVKQFQDFFLAVGAVSADKIVPLLVAAKVFGAALVGLLFCYWVKTSQLLIEMTGFRGAVLGCRTRVAMLVCAYVYSDIVSGVVHILLDHMPHDVPGLGVMARGFQYHHHQPSGITTISWFTYASHIHPVGVALVPYLWVAQPSRPAQLFYAFSWSFAHLFQTAHRWAHFPLQELPYVALILQRMKIVISSEYHMQHHQSLLDQFSTLGGSADPFLDFVSSHLIPARWYTAWYVVALGLFLLPLALDALVPCVLKHVAASEKVGSCRFSRCLRLVGSLDSIYKIS